MTLTISEHNAALTPCRPALFTDERKHDPEGAEVFVASPMGPSDLSHALLASTAERLRRGTPCSKMALEDTAVR